MNFKEYLQEARKNPDQNKFVGSYEKFQTVPTELGIGPNDEFYVSFTELDKLGINPKSPYDTPIGIYCYPASYIRERIRADNKGTKIGNYVPFAGSKPYASFFTVDDHPLVLNDMSNADFNYWVKKLEKVYIDFRLKLADQWWKKEITGSKHDTPKNYQEDQEHQWKNAVDWLERWKNESEHAAITKSWGGRFWYVAREIATDMVKQKKAINEPEGKVPVMWNKLMRDAGIKMAVDYGAGIIHGNEPNQAVVFDPTFIDKVIRWENKPDKAEANGDAYRKSSAVVKDKLLFPNPHEYSYDPVALAKKLYELEKKFNGYSYSFEDWLNDETQYISWALRNADAGSNAEKRVLQLIYNIQNKIGKRIPVATNELQKFITDTISDLKNGNTQIGMVLGSLMMAFQCLPENFHNLKPLVARLAQVKGFQKEQYKTELFYENEQEMINQFGTYENFDEFFETNANKS